MIHIHLPGPDFTATYTPTGRVRRETCRCGATRSRITVTHFCVPAAPVTVLTDWLGGRPGMSALTASVRALIALAATAVLLMPGLWR